MVEVGECSEREETGTCNGHVSLAPLVTPTTESGKCAITSSYISICGRSNVLFDSFVRTYMSIALYPGFAQTHKTTRKAWGIYTVHDIR